MQVNIENCTINGECSRCGGCCSGVLPISNKELSAIQEFVKKNGISPVNNSLLFPEKIDLTCPFYSSVKKQCNIYEVRPGICRSFICSMEEWEVKQNKRNYHSNPIYEVVYLRDVIFGQDTAKRLSDAIAAERERQGFWIRL